MKQLIPENKISEFLNITLIESRFFVFDLWMIMHFFAGGLLGYFIKDWWKVLILLVIWELFEFILWGVAFKRESITNIIWDLIIGILGFLVIRWLMWANII